MTEGPVPVPPAASDLSLLAPPDPSVDTGRRWFGGLLALLGGGAALAACQPAPEGAGPNELHSLAQGVNAASLEWFDSVTALRAFDNAGSAFSFALLLGHGSRGDGGGGLFWWTAGALPTGLANDDGIILTSTAATTGYWMRLFSGPIDVRWFGAKGNNTTDDTTAVQKAIDSAGLGQYSTAAASLGDKGWTRVYFPRGTYVISDTLTIAYDRTHLEGDGPFATTIRFAPTSGPKSALKFTKGANVLYYCSLKSLTISSLDTSQAKTAIELMDVSSFVLENVVVKAWHSTANVSTGLVTRGRELTSIRDVSIYADLPISIQANSNSASASEDMDSFRLQNLTLGCEGTDANAAAILIASGVTLGNFWLDNVNIAGGRYGIYWHDTTGTTPASNNVTIRNVKTEGHIEPAGTTGGHAIHIVTTVLYALTIDNVHCGYAATASAQHKNRGIYLRNVVNATLDNCRFLSADTNATADDSVIDVYETCNSVIWRNCVFSQWATISTGAMSRMRSEQNFATPMPPHSAYYTVSPSNAMDLMWRERDTYVNRFSGTLAAGATVDLWGPAIFNGRIGTVTVQAYDTTSATQSAGTAAFMHTSGGTRAMEKTSGTANFDVTGTPSILVSWGWNSPMWFVRIKNNFANAADYVIKLEFRD